MEASDRAAIDEVRAGNAEAFKVLVDRHSRSVFRLAYRMTGNEQDAEDIVQETFLRAYRQLARFEERSSFCTWLYRIAANCATDVLRQRSRFPTAAIASADAGADLLEAVADTRPSPDQAVFSSQVQEKVELALGGMTRAERAAFVLRHYEGRSIEEIGRILGLRTSATKHSVFRAVQKMRRALEPVVRSTA
ncbi:MAG: RNA polymerase sigma factor [Vicinamibacterales bacterium]